MSAFVIASMFPDNQIDKALAPAQCVWLYCTCYTFSQDDEDPTPPGPGGGPRPGSGPFLPSYPRPGGHSKECQEHVTTGHSTKGRLCYPASYNSGHLYQTMSFNLKPPVQTISEWLQVYVCLLSIHSTSKLFYFSHETTISVTWMVCCSLTEISC